MARALALLACVLAAAALTAAQAPAASQASSPPAPQAPAPQVMPGGFTYSPGGRRDPFTSLLRRGSDPRAGVGARPNGLAGLSVSELSLKGIVASRGGFVAIVQGSDSRTYIVREGEKLLDGTVRRITQDTMLLFEQVNDPLSLEKQREVRKVLRQTDEAK